MADDIHNTDDLRHLVTRLDKRLAELELQHTKLEMEVRRNGLRLSRLWNYVMDHLSESWAKTTERIDNAFDRIKNIERSVFPNLMNDIESVHKIIGGDGIPGQPNPLDSRKPSPRKDDPEKS